MMTGNGWEVWSKHVRAELERLSAEVAWLSSCVQELREGMAAMKTRTTIILGLVAPLVGIIGVLLGVVLTGR